MRTLSRSKNPAAFSQETSKKARCSGPSSFALQLVSARQAYTTQILSIQALWIPSVLFLLWNLSSLWTWLGHQLLKLVVLSHLPLATEASLPKSRSSLSPLCGPVLGLQETSGSIAGCWKAMGNLGHQCWPHPCTHAMGWSYRLHSVLPLEAWCYSSLWGQRSGQLDRFPHAYLSALIITLS